MAAQDPESRFRRWRRRLGPGLAVGAILLLVLVAILHQRIFVTIDAGHVGILWSRFGGGTVTDRTWGGGTHLIWPWDTMTEYSLRFQIIEEDIVAMTKDGLTVENKIVTRYKPTPESVAMLHKHVGPDYVDVLIRPEIAATAREAIAQMTPADLYSEKRGDIQNLVAKKLSRRVGLPPELVETELLDRVRDLEDREVVPDDGDSDDPKERGRKLRKKRGKAFAKDEDQDFTQVEEVLMADLALPATLSGAIEGKLRQEQADLEYVYRLQKEEKEKRRKEIAAQGVAEFQRISGISLIKWIALDATLELASSPASKVVIIGSPEEAGLPLILGPLASSAPAPEPLPPIPLVPPPPSVPGGNP